MFARVAQRIDRPVFRLTNGRHTLSNLASGIPVVMLTTTGARSGLPRTVPVLGVPADGDIAVIASNFGQHSNPGWYHNLLAHPDAQVTVEGRTSSVRAVVVEGDERARIWREGLKIYPGWAQYERRTPHRGITMFVLKPVQ